MFIEVLINGFLLHKVYGWSIHLPAALWSTLAHMLVYLKKPEENPPYRDVEQPLQPRDQPVELIPPPISSNSIPPQNPIVPPRTTNSGTLERNVATTSTAGFFAMN